MGRALDATTSQLRSGTRLHLTGVERVGTAVVLCLLAVAVAALGWYALRRGPAMLPGTVADEQVPHRAAVLRRGAIACLVSSVFVLAGSVLVAMY